MISKRDKKMKTKRKGEKGIRIVHVPLSISLKLKRKRNQE
jgi:hypothetical protein